MANRQTQVLEEQVEANVVVPAVEDEIVVSEVEETEDDVFADDEEDDIFADDSDELSKEDVIRMLLANKKHCRLYKNLTVRNVVHNTDANGFVFFTFVVKETVKGDVTTEDENGMLVKSIGSTHNIVSGGYSIVSVMKDTPKSAIFAADVLNNPKLCNDLFTGGKVDVIAHYIPANTEYINPFSSSNIPTTFDRDRILHYVIKLSFGDVGVDRYNAYINK